MPKYDDKQFAAILERLRNNDPTLTTLYLGGNGIGAAGAQDQAAIDRYLKRNQQSAREQAEQRFQQGQQLLAQQRYPEASSELQRALRLLSFDREAQKPIAEALQHVQKLQQQQKAALPEQHYQQGRQALSAQRYPEAIAAFQQALALKADFAPAQQALKEAQTEHYQQLIKAQHTYTEEKQLLEQQVQQLQQKYTEEQQAHDQSKQAIATEREVLTQAAERLRQEQARLTEEKAHWQDTLTRAQQALDEQRVQLQESQESQDSQSTYLANEQARLQHLETALNQREAELVQKQQALAVIRQQLATVRQRYTDWQEREAALLARQQQLEQEQAQLLQDKQTLQEQCQALTLRIQGLEVQQIELKKYQQAAEGLEQLKQSLHDAQQHLANREQEWQRKQAQADKAEQAYRQAQQAVSEKTELLATQLRIFQQHGLPPKERAFQQLLSDSKRLFKRNGLQPPTCFVSYAWEDDSTPAGKTANEQMQRWLGRLAGDLRKPGLFVFFDLENMHGDLRVAMRDNITKSDYFLLIGTPRLKQRIEAGLTSALKDCLENGRVVELQAGLQKLRGNTSDKTAYDPKNNATFEFIHIWAKVQQKPDALIPLLYSGSFADAIPLTIGNTLVRDANGVHDHDDQHYSLLADLSAPLGIIPAVYQLRSKDKEHQDCLKSYEPLLRGFKNTLEGIDLKLKQAQTELQAKQAAQTLVPAYNQHGLWPQRLPALRLAPVPSTTPTIAPSAANLP